MFKFLLVLFALGSTLAKPQDTSEEVLVKVAEAYKNCKKDTEITEELFKKLLKENSNPDDNLKNYNLCLYNTFNMFDAAGKLDRARFEGVLKMVFPDKTEVIMAKCPQEGPDIKEVALMISRCVAKYAF